MRFAPSASFAAIPATVNVGDIVRLNVSSSPCDGAIIRGFRVTAIGAKSVVLADTLNPTNGFKVQGWSADVTGTINTNSPVGNIVLPVGKVLSPAKTTSATIGGNLPAGRTE